MWLGYHCGHWAPVFERPLVAGADLQHLRVRQRVQGASLSVGMSRVCWGGCQAVMTDHQPVGPVSFYASKMEVESEMCGKKHKLRIYLKNIISNIKYKGNTNCAFIHSGMEKIMYWRTTVTRMRIFNGAQLTTSTTTNRSASITLLKYLNTWDVGWMLKQIKRASKANDQ